MLYVSNLPVLHTPLQTLMDHEWIPIRETNTAKTIKKKLIRCNDALNIFACTSTVSLHLWLISRLCCHMMTSFHATLFPSLLFLSSISKHQAHTHTQNKKRSCVDRGSVFEVPWHKSDLRALLTQGSQIAAVSLIICKVLKRLFHAHVWVTRFQRFSLSFLLLMIWTYYVFILVI